MDRQKVMGAVRLPAFLLIWSAGLLLLTGQFYSADAALLRASPLLAVKLAEVPRLDNPDALSEAMERALEATDVFGGEWTPKPPDATPPPSRPAPDVATTGPEPVEAAPVSALARGGAPQPAGRLARSDKPTHATVLDRSGRNQQDRAREQTGQPATGSVKLSETDAPVRKTRSTRGYALQRLKQAARRDIKKRRPDAAYRSLRASVEQGRDDVEFLGLLAVAALKTGNSAEASVIYERLVELQPGSERWWAGLAMAHEQLGLDAAPVYRQLLSLSPGESALKRLIREKIGALG